MQIIDVRASRLLAFCAVFGIAVSASGATFTVTTNADSGPGSLREAIVAANATAGTDTIAFALPGPLTIAPVTELPAITDPVLIDGATQPGGPVVLDGTATLDAGLRIQTSASTVRGLSLIRWRNASIEVRGDANTIEDNSVTANLFDGISVRSGVDNVIDGNLVSGNRTGIRLSFPSARTTVTGNLIGTDAAGNVRVPNETGVYIGDSAENTIGGTTVAARNIISGSVNQGLELAGRANRNTVSGNYIGLNAAGIAAVTNDQHGVLIGSGAYLNVVENNVISGNRTGVGFRDPCTSYNRVADNLIGLNPAGTAALPNSEYGIHVWDSRDNTIAENTISGNGFSGITFITFDFPNERQRNRVIGNRIGTDLTGTLAIGNVDEGINLWAAGNFVEENTIAFNRYGVRLRNTYAQFNVVERNTITSNTQGGVWIQNAPTNILRANTIASNSADGIFVQSTAVDDRFTANVIHSNSGMPIDLNDDGPTANDPLDPDDGANRLQNFPVLSSASCSATATSVSGTLNSTPSSTFTLEFFASNLSGDALRFLGARTVTTDALGDAPFAFTDLPPTVESFLTATAIAASGDTSELAEPIGAQESEPVTEPVLPSLTITDVELTEGGTAIFTVMLSAISASPVTVDIATVDESATAADYTPNATTLTFDPGETVQTFNVVTADDAIAESDETFTAQLANPSNATIADPTGRATLIDNDSLLTIDDVIIPEGESRSLILRLAPASSRPVTVTLTTADGTAVAADYVPLAQTVEFGPCITEMRVTLFTTEDAIDETNEMLFANLTAPVNARIADTQALVTITDDDPPPSISIDNASAEEGGIVTFNVTLSAPSALEVSVRVSTAPNTAGTGDYTPSTQVLTFPPMTVLQPFSVQTTEDILDEADETFFALLTEPVNATINDGSGTGTILDDDLSADVAVTKSANASDVFIGGTIEYTIGVTNNGPGVAMGVIVTDTLPAGATLLSADPRCSGTAPVVCTIGDLASGASTTLVLRVTTPGTPGPSVNRAEVTSATTDPNAANDVATATVGLVSAAVPALSPAMLALLALVIAAFALRVMR